MAKKQTAKKPAQDPAPVADLEPVEPPAQDPAPVETPVAPVPHPAIEIARAYQTGAGAFADVPGAHYCIPPPPVIKPSR